MARMQALRLNQAGSKFLGPVHRSSREIFTGLEFGGVAWRLVSQRQALFIQLLLEGRVSGRGHPLPKPKEIRTVSPSLAPVPLSMGSSSALHPQAMS